MKNNWVGEKNAVNKAQKNTARREKCKQLLQFTVQFQTIFAISAVPKVVILKTFNAANKEYFVNMKKFLFQYFYLTQDHNRERPPRLHIRMTS